MVEPECAGTAESAATVATDSSDDPFDYKGRVSALRDRLSASDIDAAVLFERSNVRYFTGWRQNTSSFSIVVVTPEGIRYLVPRLDEAAVCAECWIDEGDITAFPEEAPAVGRVVDLLDGTVDRIGIEAETITAHRRDALDTCGELVDLGETLTALRRTKSVAAIETYREAAAVTSDVFAAALPDAEPGDPERDVTARARYLMEVRGGEGASFEPFAMAGEHAAMPHRTATARPIETGDLVVFDMGLVWNGYATDLTRTFLFGDPEPAQQRLFEAALAAQRAAIDAVGPGVRAETVHQRAVDVLSEHGLADRFPHLTGHGLGYDIHEAPIIDAGSDAQLEPGMVVTIEPGVYVPGIGAARIEDMVLVTESGREVLTDLPRDLVTEEVTETIHAYQGA